MASILSRPQSVKEVDVGDALEIGSDGQTGLKISVREKDVKTL